MKNKEFNKLYEAVFDGLGYNVSFYYYDDIDADIPNWKKPWTTSNHNILEEYNKKRLWATSNHGFLTYMQNEKVKSCPGAIQSHPELVYLENIKVQEDALKNGDKLAIVKAVNAVTYDMISIMFVKKKNADDYEYNGMTIKEANTIKNKKYKKGDDIRCVDILMPDINGKVSSIIYSEDEDI